MKNKSFFSSLCFFLIIFIIIQNYINYNNNIASGYEPPIPIDASYSVSESQLLGVKLSIATFQLKFDKELFYWESDYCSPYIKEFSEEEKECGVCDYSSIVGCGSRDTSNVNTTTPTTTTKRGEESSVVKRDCSCGRTSELCGETQSDWKTLKENVTSDYFFSSDIVLPKFRIHFNRPGFAFKLILDAIYGEPRITVMIPNGAVMSRSSQENYFCPRSVFFFYGTYEVKVWSSTFPSKAILSYNTFSVENNERMEAELAATCSVSPFKPVCLNRNGLFGPYKCPPLIPFDFHINVTQCTQLLVQQEIVSSSSEESLPGTSAMMISGNEYVRSTSVHMISDGRPLVVNICPISDSVPTSLWIGYFNNDFNTDVMLTLIFNPVNVRKLKVSTFSSYLGTKKLFTTFNLVCPPNSNNNNNNNGNSNNKEVEFRCVAGSAELFQASCNYFSPLYPTKVINPVWPRLNYMLSLTYDNFENIYYEPSELDEFSSSLMNFVLILESQTSSIEKVVLDDWKNRLWNCSFEPMIYSPIGDENKLWTRQSIKGKEKKSVCESNLFGELVQSMNEGMNTLKKDDSFFTSRYEIDGATFTEVWQGCDKFAKSFLQTSTVEEEIETTECPASLRSQEISTTDACCSNELQWTQCCVPRKISIVKEQLIVDQSLVKSCDQSDCLSSLLEDYIFYDSLSSLPTGCSSGVKTDPRIVRFTEVDFYRSCKEQIYGQDNFGKECWSDQQCEPYSCDQVAHKCILHDFDQSSSSSSQSDVSQLFFECLIEKSPKAFLEWVQSMNEESSLMDIFLSNFTVDDCVWSYGLSEFGEHYYLSPPFAECPSCPDWTCRDESCVPPWVCEDSKAYGRLDGFCHGQLTLFSQTLEKCSETSICNWNNSLSEEQCLESFSEYFCGICETPFQCKEIEGMSKEECEGQVCLSFEGEVLIPKEGMEVCKGEDGEEWGSCSVECGENMECLNKQQCEQSGVCSDQWIFDIMTESVDGVERTFNIEFNVSNEGYCTRQMKPWNSPDCSYERQYGGDFPTSLGCLAWISKIDCEKKKYNWRSYSQTKEECLKEHTCSEPEVTGTLMTTQKDELNCEMCGGSWHPIFQWTSGEWRTGQVMKLEWKKREMVQNQRVKVPNFNELYEQIINVALDDWYQQLNNELQCSVNPKNQVLKQISCLCGSSDSESASSSEERKCFSSKDQISVGEYSIIPPSSSLNNSSSQEEEEPTLLVPPAILKLRFNDELTQVEERDGEEGKSEELLVRVFSVSSEQIQRKQPSQLATSFVNKDESGDQVENGNGRIVGRIIGTGVEIYFSQLYPIRSIELCISLSSSFLSFSSSSSSTKYSVYDFAVSKENKYVEPISVESSRNENYLCANISHLSDYWDSLLFFPIQRNEDWESGSSKLSEEEVISFSVMSAMYNMIFVVVFVYEVSVDLRTFLPTRFITLLLSLFSLLRGVYFGLVAGEVFEDNFYLVEIPTFLYFSALFTAGLLWYSIIHGTKNLVKKKIFHKIVIIFLICCLLFLVLISLLYVSFEESGTYSCGGRVYSSADTSNQETLVVSYRVIIVVLAVGITFGIIYYGKNLISSFNKSTTEQTEKSDSFRRKVFLVSGIASLSLISQCVFWIAYSLSGESSYEYCFILIVVEIIPLVILLNLLTSARKSESYKTMKSKLSTKNSYKDSKKGAVKRANDDDDDEDSEGWASQTVASDEL